MVSSLMSPGTSDYRDSGRVASYVEPKFKLVTIYPLQKFISFCRIDDELMRYCGQEDGEALFLPLNYVNPFPLDRAKGRKHRAQAYTRIEVRYPELQFELLSNDWAVVKTCQFCKHFQPSEQSPGVGLCTFWASKELRYDSCSTFDAL